MILYEVNLFVDDSVLGEFVPWLRKHVEEMLAIDGFERAQILHFDAADQSDEQRAANTGRALISCHYWLRDRAALDDYFAQHAAAMRADGMARFGGQFSAERRILSALV